MDKKIKAFLSPANQPGNVYAYGFTNEDVQCNRIAEAAKVALERTNRFEVRIGRDGSLDIEVSNAWEADIHGAIHTNSAGEEHEGEAQGTTIMVESLSAENVKLAKPILDELCKITLSHQSRGIIARPSLHELSLTHATAFYAEVDFHDNVNVAKWIIESTVLIGETIAKGMCIAKGVTYVAPVKPKPAAPKPTCTGKVPAFRLVRKTASLFGKKVGEFKTGQTFTILGKTGAWYKLNYKGATAYTYVSGVTVKGIVPR